MRAHNRVQSWGSGTALLVFHVNDVSFCRIYAWSITKKETGSGKWNLLKVWAKDDFNLNPESMTGLLWSFFSSLLCWSKKNIGPSSHPHTRESFQPAEYRFMRCFFKGLNVAFFGLLCSLKLWNFVSRTAWIHLRSSSLGVSGREAWCNQVNVVISFPSSFRLFGYSLIRVQTFPKAHRPPPAPRHVTSDQPRCLLLRPDAQATLHPDSQNLHRPSYPETLLTVKIIHLTWHPLWRIRATKVGAP